MNEFCSVLIGTTDIPTCQTENRNWRDVREAEFEYSKEESRGADLINWQQCADKYVQIAKYSSKIRRVIPYSQH